VAAIAARISIQSTNPITDSIIPSLRPPFARPLSSSLSIKNMISPPMNQRKIGNRYHAVEALFSAIPATLPTPTSFTIPPPPPAADAVVS
jgi:hypothetical protein